jgi:hypothetical protein
MAKSKEEIIREEMRAASDMMLKLCQWAVTTLIGLQTAIFFLRSSVIERMLANGELPKGEPLPWNMYLMGTFILAVVAGIFSAMTLLAGKQYRHYHLLLMANNQSGLPVPPPTNLGRILIFALYFTFPLLDILLRTFIEIKFTR